jgi:hypothetical protein
MKYITVLCFAAMIAGCGTESGSTATHNATPRDSNPLLVGSVSPETLHAALSNADGFSGTRSGQAGDGCAVYWSIATDDEPGNTLADRPKIAARSKRCAQFAKALADRLRAAGFESVQGPHLEDAAVWRKALRRR